MDLCTISFILLVIKCLVVLYLLLSSSMSIWWNENNTIYYSKCVHEVGNMEVRGDQERYPYECAGQVRSNSVTTTRVKEYKYTYQLLLYDIKTTIDLNQRALTNTNDMYHLTTTMDLFRHCSSSLTTKVYMQLTSQTSINIPGTDNVANIIHDVLVISVLLLTPTR